MNVIKSGYFKIKSAIVELATNKFINIPVILKYEDTNLIEIINEQGIGFTSQIPIYHSDGTYLAKVKVNRVFPTEVGKKAGVKTDVREEVTIFTVDDKVVFELWHQTGEGFKAIAELHTPDA